MSLRAILLFSCLWLWSLTAQATQATSSCPITIEGVYSAKAQATDTQPVNAHWEPVSLPDNWSKRWSDYTGTVWYRIDWQLNCSAQQDRPPLALTINAINMAGMVYVNDNLIWQDTHLQEPLSRSWNMPRYWVMPLSALHPGANQIMVKVIGSATLSSGLGRVNIGEASSILQIYETAWWNQRTIFLINIILSVTLGLICLSIWLLRRQEKAFGWFALASFFWVGFIANILATETTPFPNIYILAKANLSFFICYIYAFTLFTWRFANRYFPRTERTYLVLTIISLTLLWLSPISTQKDIAIGLLILNSVIFLVCSLFFQYLAFKARELEQWLLALTLMTCLLLALDSILGLLGLNKFAQPSLPYTSTIVALFLTLILAMRLTRGLKRIEHFNQELSEKIIAAEQALSTSLTNKHTITLKNTQLQERLNLSHELHDGLGSSLVRAMTTVDQSKTDISNEQFMSMLKLLRNDLRQIVDSGANVNAKPPENPNVWLAPLRHRFAQIFDELDVHMIWQVPNVWLHTPSALHCLTLYRVLEEALTNIVKHSEATEVTVQFEMTSQTLSLSIMDNGVGFDVEAVKQSGISVGMRSMQARIERLSGAINISSTKGHTMIHAHVPLSSHH